MQRRIDPSSERAIYRQLADILRHRIASGEWEPGRNLPAEADLGHEYGVSQASVRRALILLRGEGLVVRQRGRVAAVAEPREPTIVRFRRGDKACIRFRNATPEEQRDLGVDEDTLMMVIEEGGKIRVQSVRGTEIEIGDDDVPS
jgi:DNA-binding GntR family transcriptional regulator